MVSRHNRRTRPLTAQQQARFRQASQFHAMGDLGSAEQVYRSLIAEKARIPQLFFQLGQVSAQTGRDREAEKLWEKALELDPGFFQARYLLGNLLKAKGKLDRAAACYKRVIQQQPTYTQAHFTYSGINRYADRDDSHIETMLRLYRSTGLADENRIHLAFALAKAHEDIGDHGAAFSFLEEGNRLRYREYNYEISSDRELIENIIETFTPQAIAGVRANVEQSARPIFIVGMPRSGTSLVEKILATHSEVHGAGEIQDFYALAGGLFLDPQKHYQYRPLPGCPPGHFEQLGRAYLDRLARINPEAARVTDKLPFNILMAGLARLALPNATIVHCLRDARDTCLSIYKQNFTTANYRFAYDLRTTGQFYRLYEKLAEHWRQVFPGGMYEIQYEKLVSEPETEIRGLLEACGLEWQEECLAFDRSAGKVTTASAVQVRRPMYRSSVGLWKQYRDQLAPLLEELERS